MTESHVVFVHIDPRDEAAIQHFQRAETRWLPIDSYSRQPREGVVEFRIFDECIYKNFIAGLLYELKNFPGAEITDGKHEKITHSYQIRS